MSELGNLLLLTPSLINKVKWSQETDLHAVQLIMLIVHTSLVYKPLQLLKWLETCHVCGPLNEIVTHDLTLGPTITHTYSTRWWDTLIWFLFSLKQLPAWSKTHRMIETTSITHGPIYINMLLKKIPYHTNTNTNIPYGTLIQISVLQTSIIYMLHGMGHATSKRDEESMKLTMLSSWNSAAKDRNK